MKYMRMNLHDKRFRSKASSASHLPPHKLIFSNMQGFMSLPIHHYNPLPRGTEMVEGAEKKQPSQSVLQ